MSSLESVRGEVISGTLIDVQHLDVHGHGHRAPEDDGLLKLEDIYTRKNYSLEFNSVAETVPAKEWRHVSDQPSLDQTVAIKIGGSPDTLGQVGSSKKENISNDLLFVKI